MHRSKTVPAALRPKMPPQSTIPKLRDWPWEKISHGFDFLWVSKGKKEYLRETDANPRCLPFEAMQRLKVSMTRLRYK